MRRCLIPGIQSINDHGQHSSTLSCLLLDGLSIHEIQKLMSEIKLRKWSKHLLCLPSLWVSPWAAGWADCRALETKQGPRRSAPSSAWQGMPPGGQRQTCNRIYFTLLKNLFNLDMPVPWIWNKAEKVIHNQNSVWHELRGPPPSLCG